MSHYQSAQDCCVFQEQSETMGLPATPDNLTEMQRKFVAAFTSGQGCVGKPRESALFAGYSDKSPGEIGRQLLILPHIKSAIDAELQRLMTCDMKTLALDVLLSFVKSEEKDKDSKRLRLDAAKTILSYSMPKIEDQQRRGKTPEDMTIEELEMFIRNGQAALSAAAKPMIEGEVAPSGEATTAQVIDNTDN